MQCFVGIDPGLSGAIVVLWENGRADFADTPTITVKRAKMNRREYDVEAMNRLLSCVCDEVRLVVLEQQQPMAGRSAGHNAGLLATFSLGYGYGVWSGLIAANKLPMQLVRPLEWKRDLVGLKSAKGESILVAKRLFPSAAEHLKLKKHHGRSDALLLAEWGRRRVGAAAVPNGGPF